MRNEDLKRLRVPFHEGEDLDQGFARAVEVQVPAIHKLYQEISNDLDDQVFGVRWWASQLDTVRPILISDHLASYVSSVQTNLIEASHARSIQKGGDL